jgi:hypothetical protein
MATFIGRYAYDHAVDQIVRLKACPLAGKVTADQVKIALGEYLDIWPESIADDETNDGSY